MGHHVKRAVSAATAACLALVMVCGACLAADARMPAQAVYRGLVILVDFQDVRPSVRRNAVEARFAQQLNAYVREMSYGTASLGIDVTSNWYTMPEPVARYRISPRNLEVDKSRVRKLIDDALSAVDRDYDVSKYAFVALLMAASLDQYGMIGLCGYPGMLGWSAGDTLKTPSGKTVSGVAIFCHQAHLGTLFHDVAHILGGVKGARRMVPCLYDHDLQARPGPLRETFVNSLVNMGFWDPMSCHFRERGVPPPGICSWTKLRLGWIEQSKVRIVKAGEQAELTLGPLETGSSEILAIKVPLSETAYYLIENRQPIGFDRYLPGSGVLIMFCEDAIVECRQGRAPVKLVDANPSIPRLEGAAFDAGRSFQDSTNGITVQVKEKVGGSYKLVVTRR